MFNKKIALHGLLILLSVFILTGTSWSLTDKEELGKSIYFDTNLSINANQSCATCHAPEAGWVGPDSSVNETTVVYPGSVNTRFGNRKPPSAAYATPAPILHFVTNGNGNGRGQATLFIGGNFWDGRATGERLGSPTAEQAIGPFLNPMEQALPDNACVVYKVCIASYPVSFDSVWPDSCNINWPLDIEALCAVDGGQVTLSDEDRAKVNTVYDNIGRTIAAYEGSSEVNQYTSKYDYYLQGMVELTPEEAMGLKLFSGKAKCAQCHTATSGSNGEPPLFTDYAFDNLGVPKNVDNPWYDMSAEFNPDGENWLDKGLGAFLFSHIDYEQYAPENYGKHKVATLRNVAKGSCEAEPSNPDCITKAYTHNGYFKSLKSLVHFYNTRDIKPACPEPLTSEADALDQGCWPEAEITSNVNTKLLGDLKLTDFQEDALVSFMKTLTDGYQPQ